MCLLFWPFKNSDNLEFLKAYHAGLGEEICFFSSQKNTYNICNCFNQLQLSITVRSQDCHEFCFRWSMKIRSNYEQPKQGVLGSWEITRKQIRTSPFHLWFEMVFFGWFDFIFLFLVWLHSLPPCCPATTRLFSITWRANTCTRIVIVFYLSRSYSSTTSIIEESLRLEFQFIVVFYHSRSFFPAQKERRVCLYLTESEHLFSLPSIFRHSASLVAFAFCKMSRYKEQ